MNDKTGGSGNENRSVKQNDAKQDKDEGLLEKVGKVLDPSGREVSDDELIDPGSNIPDSKPASTRPVPNNPKPADHK